MRQWITPRSLMLHVFFVLIAGGCLVAGWWQVHRAMQGNTLSYLYSVEWPAFAVVAGIGWWQMFHDTPEDIRERKAFHQRMRAASAEVVARTLPRSARAITVGTQDADARTLGRPARAPALTDGSDRDSGDGQVVPAGWSLVHSGLTGATRLLADDEDDGPSDEMSDYNRYLAVLAVRGKAKTWRNPRGV